MWSFLKDLVSVPEPVSTEVQGPPAPKPEAAPVQVPTQVPTVCRDTTDPKEQEKLSRLYPPFKASVEAFLSKAREAGLKVYIFEGERTWQRQAELYAKGRDANGVVVNKKLVVTNAKPGSSFHNYNLAVDIVFDGDEAKPGVQWSWNQPPKKWRQLGQIGMECGLEWAGTWQFQEFPHFQYKTPLRIAQLKEAYLAGGLERVWALVGVTA